MEQSHWDACDDLSSCYSGHLSPSVPNNSTPISRLALRNKFSADEVAFPCPPQFQQALQSLQQYPKSFIHAWLLMAKSLGMSAQSVRDQHQQGSALAIEQLQAITILQDLPHDQVLAWYGGDATRGELLLSSLVGHTTYSLSTVRDSRRVRLTRKPLLGQDIDSNYHCSHSFSSPCRSSTCSTVWTKTSSSRPSSRSSFTSLRPLSGIQDREKRSSRRPPSNCLGDLIEASETDILPQDQHVASSSLSNASTSATPQQTEKNCTYQCTGCSRTFKSMQTWARHEKEDHEDISFPCMPNGAIEITGDGRACALCGQEPTEEHLRSHNIERCTQLKQVFKRSDHLKQHLESHGLAKKSRRSDLLVTKWQRVPDKRAWACGFCKAVSTSLMDFHKHVAVQHYERGEDRKWDHTKVIIGLLSQSHIAGPWERLLASRFRVQSLSCKWSKTKSGCLQTRLELGQEPGEVLAEAALECAIYDRDLLHEAFRPQESSTAGLTRNSSPTALGPPVPPKPLSFQPPSCSENMFGSNGGQGPVDLMTLSSFDQFKTPSPPLLDLSPRAWEFYMSCLDQADRDYQYDWNSYVDPGLLVQPMDIDVDQKLGFPS
ncbi:MAG: hypothetical protein L6R42_000217 [Xanthoria sp. 1 TBL-2021]|nr:MAG: hypothetical protein L6R42_000217 [Xanthoria sp. 1 TBL-2021]